MTNPQESTAVAVRSSTDLEQLGELEQILLTNTAPDAEVEQDPEEITRQIIAELLAAETDADLEGSAVGWRDNLEVPYQLRGFHWRPSSFEDGSAVYFVVRAINLHTGELQLLTTGSRYVLAQLTNMARRETLVGAVRELVESGQTAQGFKPLRLRTPENIPTPAPADHGGALDDQTDESAAA